MGRDADGDAGAGEAGAAEERSAEDLAGIGRSRRGLCPAAVVGVMGCRPPRSGLLGTGIRSVRSLAVLPSCCLRAPVVRPASGGQRVPALHVPLSDCRCRKDPRGAGMPVGADPDGVGGVRAGGSGIRLGSSSPW